MAKILLLGSGFGGVSAACALRERLPAPHEITLIDRTATFHFGAEKTWVALGHRRAEAIVRSLSGLERKGIRVVKAEVSRIDAARKSVETSGGSFSADFLVIALGADMNMGAVPGLAESAHSFYSIDGAARLRRALDSFRGGELVLLIPKAPFKCPPAPYEGAFLLHDELRKSGLLDKTRISLYTVEGAPMATAGPEIGEFVSAELAQREIAYHRLANATSVDGVSRSVKFEGGTEAKFDLLVAVPPHEPPKAVRESGLGGPAGWIPAGPKRLRVAAHDGVYAIGDVAAVPLPGRFKPDAPLALPKAGVFADAQGKVVAADIADRILGTDEARDFDGEGFCFIEMGDMHAVKGEGHFFRTPRPTMDRRVPDMAQFVEKKEWIREWVAWHLK